MRPLRCSSVARAIHSFALDLHAALALAMLPHTYTQTNKEVVLYVPLAADVRAKEVQFKCTSQQLSLSVRGAELQGEFFLAVKPDESTWELEDEPTGRRLRVGLCKARPNHKWDCCFLHEVDVSHHTGDPSPPALGTLPRCPRCRAPAL